MIKRVCALAEELNSKVHLAIITSDVIPQHKIRAIANDLMPLLKIANPNMFIKEGNATYFLVENQDNLSLSPLIEKQNSVSLTLIDSISYFIIAPKTSIIERMIKLAKRHGLDPTECILLDANNTTIAEAEKKGFKTVNFANVDEEIKTFLNNKSSTKSNSSTNDFNFLNQINNEKYKALSGRVISIIEKQTFEPLKERIRNKTVNEAEFIRLSPDSCFTFLWWTGNTGLNYFCELAQKPDFINYTKILCERACSSTGGKAVLIELVSTKKIGRTPLYHAAEHANVILVEYLRTNFDAPVNNAGPIDNPCALNVAAKVGAFDVVSAIIKSKSRLKLYQSIRCNIPDLQGNTAAHWVAQYKGNDIKKAAHTMYEILTSEYLTDISVHCLSSNTNSEGHSPFFYLLENEHILDFLKYLVAKGKGISSITTWYLDTYFDFNTVRKNGFTDLEWAYKTKPQVADYIEKNIYHTALATNAKQKLGLNNCTAIHQDTAEVTKVPELLPLIQELSLTQKNDDDFGIAPSPVIIVSNKSLPEKTLPEKLEPEMPISGNQLLRKRNVKKQ
ncbi:MAG: hypothetical protein JSS07_03295 [Proteobacteria bacterium]|nr:hypothetical protein [Pseudomonadota bacterium]